MKKEIKKKLITFAVVLVALCLCDLLSLRYGTEFFAPND